MILSKRERIIFGVVAAGAALFLADFFIVQKMQESRRVAEEIDKPRLANQLQEGTAALSHQRDLASKWKEIVDGGLKHDPTEAESQILHALADWSREAGVKLVAVKPERAIERENLKKPLQEITFVASGTGSMSNIRLLLYRIETSKIPLRVKSLQLGSRKEGTDDLSVELRLSTLYEPVRAATIDPTAATSVAASKTAATAVAASKTGGAQ
jgi:hypothetical protein